MSDPNESNGQVPFGEQQVPPASSNPNPAEGSSQTYEQPRYEQSRPAPSPEAQSRPAPTSSDQTPYGQPQYNQPQQGQPQPDQPEYGQYQTGQPPYGQPQYPQYVQSEQGQPNWQAPSQPAGQPGQPQYGPQGAQYPPPGTPYGGQPYGSVPYGYSPRQKIVAGILGILLGAFGVHNFYLGYTGKAVAQVLITVLSIGILSWVSAIWGLVEGILILVSQPGTTWHRDARGVELQD